MMQSAVTKFEIFSPVYLAGHGMEDDFSIFQTGIFPFHTSIPKYV